MLKPKILLIYTGGTIGMLSDPSTNILVPFDFERLLQQIPELKQYDIELDTISFEEPIDSSDMEISHWQKLGDTINENYDIYNGFVVLHGSDTMAYTASALSFMFDGIKKPIILTGSQLPIGTIRTDGKENLITSIEIAAATNQNENPIIQEVAIYFEYKLYRGNRTTKVSAKYFEAFHSYNYPPLAEAGVDIEYNSPVIKSNQEEKRHTYFNQFDNNVSSLKIYPGISKNQIENTFNQKGLKAVILESFGAGNMPTNTWFIELLANALNKGIIIYNITQCLGGSVEHGKYITSSKLDEIGVIEGKDITYEAAITKMMYLLGKYPNNIDKIKEFLPLSIRGEITE